MSCPDWSRLMAPGAGAGDAAERSWTEATEHLRHCRRCAAAAQERDPLLLFQRLPRVEIGEQDILAMQQRVAGARRVLAAPAEPTRGKRPRAGLLAAAAVLTLGVSLVAYDLGIETPRQRSVVAASAGDPLALEEAYREASKHLAMLPLVEGGGPISQQVQGPTFDWLSFDSE